MPAGVSDRVDRSLRHLRADRTVQVGVAIGQHGIGRSRGAHINTAPTLSTGAQLVTESGVLQELACLRLVVVSDDDPQREGANRALYDADISIENVVRDTSLREQRLDRRHEYGIVGANEFAHRPSAAHRRRHCCPAYADRRAAWCVPVI